MSKARQAADEVNRQQAGRRNLIINGAMQVWQRGTSFTSIANLKYCADRFYIARTNSVNISRVSCSLDEFKYAHRGTNVTSGNHTLYQAVENDGQFYEGQTFTISFWARASENTTQRTGRIWDGSAYVTSYETIDVTTSWQYFTATVTLNSSWAGTEDALRVQVVSGHSASMSANGWIEVTGVQLEVGDVATPFEHRSYGEELALCQRYYVKFGENSSAGERIGAGVCSSATQAGISLGLSCPMRTTPTASFSNIQVSDLAANLAVTSVAATYLHGSQLFSWFNSASGLTTSNGACLRVSSSGGHVAYDAEL